MFSRWKKKGGLILAAVLMFTQLGSMGCGKAVYASEKEAAILQDTNFTGSLWDDGIWTVSPSTWDNVSFSYFTYADDEWMATESEEGTSGFKFWMANGGEYTLTQWVDSLPAGTYTLTSYVMGSGADVSLKVNDSVSDSVSLAGYNQWQKVSATFEVSEDGAGATVGFDVDVATDGWGYLDQLSMTIKSGDDEEDIPEDNPDTGDIEVEPVESDIYVEHVALSDDFITGADISSYLALVDSGAKFYDFDGNELDKQGFFNFLADNGTNWVRIRVWNNPYDASGNGYGGGNNDLAKAIEMGKLATNAGMKVLIDFHYSDFWADPAKQQAPKAWSAMSVSEKEEAVAEYTTDSLNALLAAGVDVEMVQIGNETTSKFVGESSWINICKLFNAGAGAVRAIDPQIMVAIHFTNPERSGNYATLAKYLNDNDVDYDVFASSYYPYWHGTLDNLSSVLSNVAKTYGKKVMVAETSWAYTLDDGDGHDNTVRVNNNDKDQPYNFSVQGQATEISSVVKTVSNITNGIGVFYWEAAWLPVQYAYDEAGNLDQTILASNKQEWEANGSGWASSYAGEYDANDAGKWFGGSAVDNQAWFDFTGHPLETAKIYNLVRTGTTTPVTVTSIDVADVEVELSNAASVELPETAVVSYNNGATETVQVSWEESSLEEAVASGIGSYTIKGTVTVKDELHEVEINLVITADNLIVNGGFESGLDNWNVTGFNTSDAASNSRTGKGCLHFYTANSGDSMTATQEVVVDAGIYKLSAFLQGGDASSSDVFTVSAAVGDEVYSVNGKVDGWKVWDNLVTEEIVVTEDNTTVTVTLSVSDTTGGVWGSFDDVTLVKVSDYSAPSITPDEKEETDNEAVVPATPVVPTVVVQAVVKVVTVIVKVVKTILGWFR